MEALPTPPPLVRLLGGEYVFGATGKRVVVVDFEFLEPRGRTGRLIVTPVGEHAGIPWVVTPEELLELQGDGLAATGSGTVAGG